MLGEKATHKKLTEVNGDAVEEEVSIAGSIVDGNKALEVLVEHFCRGVGLIAEEVVADLPDVLEHKVSDVFDFFTWTTEVISDDLYKCLMLALQEVSGGCYEATISHGTLVPLP